MTIGTYKTTDPNKRIRVMQDDDFHDDPHYAEGVREALQESYDAGDYYGVIVENREMCARVTEDEDGNVTLHDPEYRWVEGDSIWSCAGYGDKVAETVAKEYFGLTVTGKM